MSALLDSLVAAGISASAAARIADAVRQQVVEYSQVSPPVPESANPPENKTPSKGAASGDVYANKVQVEKGLYSLGHAHFAGDNAFDGSVHFRGSVNWHGARKPANAVVTSMVSAVGSGRVAFMQKQVAVLNDYGNSKPISMMAGVYAKTASPSSDLVPHVVVTGVSFDAENCAVVAATTTVYGMASTAQPWLYSATASTSLCRLFMGEGITWSVT